MNRDSGNLPAPRPSGPRAAERWASQGIQPISARTFPTTTAFTVRAPASSANLGPGFDAVGLALDLWNELEVDPNGPAGDVRIEGRDADLLAGADGEERENLVLRAMRQLAGAHGWDLPPVALTLRNQVPVSRGLGSSAAALIAGLVATDHLLGLGLSKSEILAHAWRMEGHGDNVGATLYGGAILAVPGVSDPIQLWGGGKGRTGHDEASGAVASANGRHGDPTAAGNELPAGLTAVVFIPDLTGATWAARAALPERIPHSDAAFNVAMVAGLVTGLALGEAHLIGASMHDRLHQPYRARLFPHLTPVTEAALEAGAVGACLSGAGPTILALVAPSCAEAVMRAMAEAAAHAGVHGETREVRPVATGAHIVES